MRPGPSPLVGYNTNVRHKGKLYHIQTEDSGVNHPHVITHLFADGGRIIASRKTAYAGEVSRKDLAEFVKKLMQDQHKAMFIALRDCAYDEDAPEADAAAEPSDTDRPPASLAPQASAPLEEIDVDALERAAQARLAESATARAGHDSARRGAGKYQQTVAAQARPVEPAAPKSAASIFGGEVLRGKSLDEVILSYLSDDVGERER